MPTKSIPSQPAPNSLPPEGSITKRSPGRKPKPIVEFPEVITPDWLDPPSFDEALSLHVLRHGESICHLHRALCHQGDHIERSTLLQWAAGKKAPRTVTSLAILNQIERRYRLPHGYFKSKLANLCRAPSGHKELNGISDTERRRLAWHLPDDFDIRPAAERNEILDWVRTVIISGSTDYRRFQAEAAKNRFAVRFPSLTGRKQLKVAQEHDDHDRFMNDVELDLLAASMDAPPALAAEVEELIRFKTSTLTDIGFQRNGVWNEYTAFQKIEHLGLLFGALAASPRSKVLGRGVPAQRLAMGMLVFPAVWDWYIQWRERRRGFFTVWEVNMLQLGLSLARAETGWVRQNPALGRRLTALIRDDVVAGEDQSLAAAGG